MLSEMWAQGRYDLRLSDREFWALTPRQFHLLFDRHRAALVHREMVHGFTTAAVINSAPFERDKAATALQYMPNHPDFAGSIKPALTEEQETQNVLYNAKVQQLAVELKRKGGPLLSRVLRGEKV